MTSVLDDSGGRAGARENGADLRAVFPGDSEMAGRMRALDWSTTPLGAPERWPPHLRTALGICLTSRWPMLVCWGNELALFYNDACIPLLGPKKHPVVLGRPAREAWAEVWDQIGPTIQRVMTVGEASWSEDTLVFLDRTVPEEEVYVTCSFSPVLGADGHPDGIYCAITETTGKIVGARRLDTLRRLAQAAGTHSAEEACNAAAGALSENAFDIPFAAIYVIDGSRAGAQLVARARRPDPEWSLPEVVALDAESPGAAAVMRAALRSREPGELEAPRPDRAARAPWPYAASHALVLPIRASTHDTVAGFLVAGTSPRRPLDAAYRDFLDRVQGQIGRAIADARAYEAERRRAEALAALDAAKTTFFANVSHEFRTPITLMLGPLEDAIAELPATSPVYERLEMVRRNGLRLLKLVNNLLDFSRLQSGRARGMFVPTDLAALTADLASNFRAACERGGIALVVDCPPLPAPVYVDRAMWEDVVLNLLSNALKFTLTGEIRVTLTADGRDAVLSVVDTGIGIPAKELGRIFQRFQRARSAGGRTLEGTGIGLSLVKEAVRLHGGEVSAASTRGFGSTFRVRIPFGTAHLDPAHVVLAEPTVLTSTASAAEPYVQEALGWNDGGLDAHAAGPLLRSPLPVQSWRPTTPRFRVLVADDNADLREYVASLLAPYAEVETAANGMQAMHMLDFFPYDLLLADAMMPALDGFALLRWVRSSPTLRLLPVVLLSARAGSEARAEGLEAGADDYIVKPFAARELVVRIVTVLALARARTKAVLDEVEQLVAERTAERDRLRRELVEAEEGERRRLARELHDQLGQELTALRLGLEDALRLADAGQETALHTRLATLQALATELTLGAREIALELRPPELDDVGLVSALETYVARWQAHYGIEAAVEITDPAAAERVPTALGSAIYRIVQEALTNVAKHADAREVSVMIDSANGELRLLVEDDGCGFDVEATAARARRERRLGLLGMHERATLVAGTLEVESSPGNGTTLYVRVPLSASGS